MSEDRLRAALHRIYMTAVEAEEGLEERKNKQDIAYVQGLKVAANIAAQALDEPDRPALRIAS